MTAMSHKERTKISDSVIKRTSSQKKIRIVKCSSVCNLYNFLLRKKRDRVLVLERLHTSGVRNIRDSNIHDPAWHITGINGAGFKQPGNSILT